MRLVGSILYASLILKFYIAYGCHLRLFIINLLLSLEDSAYFMLLQSGLSASSLFANAPAFATRCSQQQPL